MNKELLLNEEEQKLFNELNCNVLLEDIVNASIGWIDIEPYGKRGRLATVIVYVFERALLAGQPSFGPKSDPWNHVRRIDKEPINTDIQIDPDEEKYEPLGFKPVEEIKSWIFRALNKYTASHTIFGPKEMEKLDPKKGKTGRGYADKGGWYDIKRMWKIVVDLPAKPFKKTVEQFDRLLKNTPKPDWFQIVGDPEWGVHGAWHIVTKVDETAAKMPIPDPEEKEKEEAERKRKEFEKATKRVGKVGERTAAEAEKLWDKIVNSLSNQLGIEPYQTESALIDYLHTIDPIAIPLEFNIRYALPEIRTRALQLAKAIKPEYLKVEDVINLHQAILEEVKVDTPLGRSVIRIVKDHPGIKANEIQELLPDSLKSGTQEFLDNVSSDYMVNDGSGWRNANS